MENINIVLAMNIQKYRKKRGLTQEQIAENLGVTFQAVSKWENAKSAPDILFLPKIAELFECSIDELFSDNINNKNNYDFCTELPWNDDDILRGVVFLGRNTIQVTDEMNDKFTFEIIGDTKSVQSECNIIVNGSVSGGCNANGRIVIDGHLSGGCNSGGDVTVSGDFSGGCNCNMNVTCGGNFSGDINCNEKVIVNGDVEADKIEGNVVCNSLQCNLIKGDVTIKGES